jgi:hypothetical protein
VPSPTSPTSTTRPASRPAVHPRTTREDRPVPTRKGAAGERRQARQQHPSAARPVFRPKARGAMPSALAAEFREQRDREQRADSTAVQPHIGRQHGRAARRSQRDHASSSTANRSTDVGDATVNGIINRSRDCARAVDRRSTSS